MAAKKLACELKWAMQDEVEWMCTDKMCRPWVGKRCRTFSLETSVGVSRMDSKSEIAKRAVCGRWMVVGSGMGADSLRARL